MAIIWMRRAIAHIVTFVTLQLIYICCVYEQIFVEVRKHESGFRMFNNNLIKLNIKA